MMNQRRDADFLRGAYHYAAMNSQDPRTQNGAIIVGPGWREVSFGANRLPRGVEYCRLRTDSAVKRFYIEHAERDAILRARERLDDNMTLYCPWSACHECARAIILAGIKEVVYHEDLILKTPDRWQDSITTGAEIMLEAGVALRYFRGKIGGVRIMFDGQIWEP